MTLKGVCVDTCQTTSVIPAGPQDGLTPLLWAAARGSKAVVEALVKAGADKEARDTVGADRDCSKQHQSQCVCVARTSIGASCTPSSSACNVQSRCLCIT